MIVAKNYHATAPSTGVVAFLTMLLQWLLLWSILALLLWATWHDLKTREIPDWISVLIASVGLLGSVGGWLGPDFYWWLSLSGGAVATVIGVGLFHFAALGGGDVKLIAALGMVLGPVGIIMLLIFMGVAGGVLAAVALLRKQPDYAYAPAIAVGYIGCMLIVYVA